MSALRRIHGVAGLAALLSLAGCGSLLETTVPPPQLYVLRLAPAAQSTVTASAGSVQVLRPAAGPGLDVDRIILLRSGQRVDSFAASRWAAPAPDMVASMIVDALRANGSFVAVFDDASPYPPQYNLRVALRRFEADYTSGNGPPTIHVTLDATLGRHRDRELIASFAVQQSVRADEDRMGAVVAAFEEATSAAVHALAGEAAAAVADEPSPASARK